MDQQLPAMRHRNTPDEIQSMSIVILRGLIDSNPGLSCVGWVEDEPTSEDSFTTLHEPIYFIQSPPEAPSQTNPNPPQKIQFLMPQLEIPTKIDFFEYTKREFYDGISDFGAMYIKAVLFCRKVKPTYTPGWAVADIPHVTPAVHLGPKQN